MTKDDHEIKQAKRWMKKKKRQNGSPQKRIRHKQHRLNCSFLVLSDEQNSESKASTWSRRRRRMYLLFTTHNQNGRKRERRATLWIRIRPKHGKSSCCNATHNNSWPPWLQLQDDPIRSGGWTDGWDVAWMEVEQREMVIAIFGNLLLRLLRWLKSPLALLLLILERGYDTTRWQSGWGTGRQISPREDSL